MAGVRQRVLHARLPEALEAELAGVAHAARPLPALVAGPRELPGDAELLPLADDVRFRHGDQGRPDLDEIALDTALRPEAGDLLEGQVELRATIGVSAEIDCVCGDVDGLRAACLGESEGVTQKDRVAGRDVRGRDALADLLEAALLGHLDLRVRQRGPADRAEVQGHDAVVPHAEVPRDLPGGVDLPAVPLAVVEGQGDDVQALPLRDCEGGGGVHPAAEEDDGAVGHGEANSGAA